MNGPAFISSFSASIKSLTLISVVTITTACGGGGDDGDSKTPDTLPPEITLNGEANIQLDVGSEYVEAGATVQDNIDGELDVTIEGDVDTNAVGEYTLSYTATDSAGNGKTEFRTVTVADLSGPVITLNGEATITLEFGAEFTDPGYSATDNLDDAVDVTVTGEINTQTLGEQTLTYTAADKAGNETSVTRTVIVNDNTKPVITLQGGNPFAIEINSDYQEPGFSAIDSVDGELAVQVQNEIDITKVGKYTITYTATDSSNNTVTANRTVNVKDSISPTITLKGDNPIEMNEDRDFVDPGYSTNDNSNVKPIVMVEGELDTSVPGAYTLTYTATDASGNSDVVTRIVKVLDITKPTIELNGESTIVHAHGMAFEDPGVTVTDNVEQELTVTVTGEVDITKLGAYELTYSVEDQAGNKASIARTVNVTDQTKPEITLVGKAQIELPQGLEFIDPGYSALDQIDGDVAVVTTSNLDIYTLGDYTITYSATDDAGNKATETRGVTVREFRPFITTWKTDNEGKTEYNQIEILTSGEANFTVDWGDGQVEGNLTESVVHTYDSAGTYTVKISGKFPRIYFPRYSQNSDNLKITSIDQWGDIRWESMSQAFSLARNMILKAKDAPNLSRVVSMRYMFERTKVGTNNLNHWDTSNIMSMHGVFLHAKQFNGNISNWDVSSVESLYAMFYGATRFQGDLSSWNVSNVQDMTTVFFQTNYNRDISGWNVSSVTSMQSMFANSRFNKNISNWDISKVNNMYKIFGGSPLSTENYDAILQGWASLPEVQSEVQLGADGIQYSEEAESARSVLINTYGWDITDGGMVEQPPQ